MKIYTSYFARVPKIRSGDIPIDISRFSPKWLEGIATYRALAPSEQFVLDCKAGKVPTSEEYYKRYYEEVLNNLEPEEVVEDLRKLANGSNVVLLCYEVPGERCHRRHVAEWLEIALGYIVEEYAA